MKTILVTATEESTGKTAVALALAKIAAERGLSVGYMKPKGTRLQSNVGKTLDEDPMLARELLDLDAEMHDLEPVVYSPTFIEQAIRGREDPDELREQVRESFDSLAEGKDLMVIEGGGKLTTGGIVGLTDADVADLLDAEVLLLSKYSQAGDVDDVLAAAEDVRAGDEDRLLGVLFNAVQEGNFDGLETEVVPFLEGRGIPVLGVVPREQELAGVTVDGLAEELSAEQLNSAPGDAFVERFLVGAMSGDSALRHLRRTKDAALITGGDRPDLQRVALEAPGVKCLILTGGYRPPGAVVGKAEEKGVPVLLVQSDTLTTVERAEDIVRSGRTRDAETVETMRNLLHDHADVEAIVGDAGPTGDEASADEDGDGTE
ncbi:phosphotransacetylase family protein [Halorussus gelatinilyticus]|uniref:Phosphotransacetylase family protein n=1 Tax=Halorussus gelatinilyticus TaxID=2937524 RepID=A0A8U0IFJ8_9EURY|nr:phosphotransacetylase family protein [Halorussus gelatinilyticus]UPV99752.1 phosphotransacetylase family protein [Halorussus gelatinilyticus]